MRGKEETSESYSQCSEAEASEVRRSIVHNISSRLEKAREQAKKRELDKADKECSRSKMPVKEAGQTVRRKVEIKRGKASISEMEKERGRKPYVRMGTRFRQFSSGSPSKP